MPRKHASDALLLELRAFGLAYPGAHTKSPWPGHLDLAVNDKTFAYLSLEGEPLGIGCKLPHSADAALMLPHTEPTPYGLGKSGWVSAKFPAGEEPPAELLKAWIDESYRAQAPKRMIKELDARGPAGRTPAAAKQPAAKKVAATAPRTEKKKVAAKRPATKKPATKKPTTKKPPTKKKAAAKR